MAFLMLTLIACTKNGNGNRLLDESNKNQSTNSKNQENLNKFSKDKKNYPSDPVITHYAFLKTSIGKVTIGLYGEDAPETVANFIGLTKMKYYNGMLIHRIAKNFLVQMGDSYTRTTADKALWGTGGETFNGGELLDELDPETPSYKIGYEKGVVAMANKGPRTATSQFFICLEEAKFIKHNWTIFGRVIDGLDIVERISQAEIEPSKHDISDGTPIKPIRILNLRIVLIKAPRRIL